MKRVREDLKPVYPKWVLNYISSIRPFNQVVIADAQHEEDSMQNCRACTNRWLRWRLEAQAGVGVAAVTGELEAEKRGCIPKYPLLLGGDSAHL